MHSTTFFEMNGPEKNTVCGYFSFLRGKGGGVGKTRRKRPKVRLGVVFVVGEFVSALSVECSEILVR